MKKIIVINGPNLNLLGKRELEIYGKKTFKQIEDEVKEFGKNNNLSIDFKQSNDESEYLSIRRSSSS